MLLPVICKYVIITGFAIMHSKFNPIVYYQINNSCFNFYQYTIKNNTINTGHTFLLLMADLSYS